MSDEDFQRMKRNVDKMTSAPLGVWITLEPHGLQKSYRIKKLADKMEVEINGREV